MNLILFDKHFETISLDKEDPRVEHIRTVLKIPVGGVFYVGFANAKRALVRLNSIGRDGRYTLSLVAEEVVPKPLPIHLCIAMPRPHTAKRILFEASSLGVASIYFFRSEKGQASYFKSSLWKDKNYEQRLVLGTEQSFATHLPDVHIDYSLEEVLEINGNENAFALDNYGSSRTLGKAVVPNAKSCSLALGPEGGFSNKERELFEQFQWERVHLGPRVLRLETAVVASAAVVSERMNCWTAPTITEFCRNNG